MDSPRLTVDCVISDAAGNIVFVRRKYDPFKGSYALPGGFVEIGETVEDACRREIREETNLELNDMRLVGVYSKPGRDPRRHTVTIAFAARADLSRLKAGDDAADAVAIGDWRDHALAFDHRQIVEDALSHAAPRAR
jgi:8-oxo-dGTP diphosphatase